MVNRRPTRSQQEVQPGVLGFQLALGVGNDTHRLGRAVEELREKIIATTQRPT